MARRKQLSSDNRASIVALHTHGGLSQVKIAEILKCSRHAVQETIKRYQQTASNKDRSRSGRPRVTSKMTDKQIKLISLRDRQKTAATIQAEINAMSSKPISVSTVKRRLNSYGLRGCIAKRKPLLRSVNVKKRLTWAKEHYSWTYQQWCKVLFTDESKFQLFGSHRRQYVRRRQNESLLSQCLQPTIKFGGGSIIVWGSFSGSGVGSLVPVEGTMKKEDYLSILRDYAVPDGMRLIGKGFIFQEDNDPKHKSHLCQDFIRTKSQSRDLVLMNWPPQSPDLSPIELLWDHLDRKLRAHPIPPKNSKHLLRILQHEWQCIPVSVLQKLIHRMPQVCKAVIHARGRHINEKTL